MSIELKTPAASLIYTFEWQDAIPEGVDLVSVEHTVPEGLTLVAQQTDQLAQLSTVEVGGGVHGGIYLVKALALLSSSEEVPADFTLRVSAS
jgi:hypothetical protein